MNRKTAANTKNTKTSASKKRCKLTAQNRSAPGQQEDSTTKSYGTRAPGHYS